MKISIIRNFKDFDRLHDSWNNLLIFSEQNSVFLTHEWFSSFIKAFDLENKLSIIIAHEHSNLIGILPLYKERVKYGLLKSHVLKSISNVHTQKFNFISKAGYENVFPEVLLQCIKILNWDMIHIDYVGQSSFMVRDYCLFNRRCLKTELISIMESPRIKINSKWEKYYNEKFSKSLRKNIEKCTRKAQREFKISFENIDGNNFKDEDLAEAFIIEDSGWKGKNGSSILKNKSFKRFYQELSLITNMRGWFALRFLKFDTRRVAFDYSLRYMGNENPLKSGYYEEYKKFSPGLILRKLAIKKAFDDKCRVYDLLGRSDNYKLKMANGKETLYSVFFFNNRLNSRLLKFFLFDFKYFLERIGVKDQLKRLFYKLRKQAIKIEK